MTRAEFNKWREGFSDRAKQVLDEKGRDYSASNDHFDNFKRHAKSMALTPEQIWQVLFMKHIDALSSYIRCGGAFESEPIERRIIDLRNYLDLLAARIAEGRSCEQHAE